MAFTAKQQKYWIDQARQFKHATPYMLTNVSLAIQAFEKLQKSIPRTKVFYSVKTNSDRKLLQALSTHVYGFEVASLGELKMLDGIFFDPTRIIFSNPVKIPSHVKQAYKRGVRQFAIDSFDEIKKMQQYAPGSHVHIRVKISNHGSRQDLSNKFGLPKDRIKACAIAAREAGLNVNGLTFHVGSQAESLDVWSAAFDTCGDLIKQLRHEGFDIKFIDMAGGFPAGYDESVPSISTIGHIINKAVRKHLPKDIELLAEPGRFIVADSSVIIASVIARQERDGIDWLYLDMGAFQGLLELLELDKLQYPVFAVSKRHNSHKKEEFVLTGPTCDSFDTIGYGYQLPADVRVGDKIGLGMTGAYTLVYGTNFNGIKMPGVHYVS